MWNLTGLDSSQKLPPVWT
ncbi:UNVERIFIED_CONTAM: hypothetical protein GTU68_044123 [Idotea baltica]|nr:hypothetical protein [Idotea baltica]